MLCIGMLNNHEAIPSCFQSAHLFHALQLLFSTQGSGLPGASIIQLFFSVLQEIQQMLLAPQPRLLVACILYTSIILRAS